NNPILKKIMVGVRPVGLGLVTAVIVNLILTNYYTDGSLEWICIAIGALATVLLIKFKVSIPKIIGIAAVLGIIFLR
ncbi:MAG: chromate transporter, partial [Firmicutes bacterium]|nr:chromate transporter [Bacillota bacterium]